MIDKQKIIAPVEAEFERFVSDLNASLESDVPLLQKTIGHVLRSQGKHIRPLLLLLAAKTCGEPNATTQNAALLVELLHTTTLIHDDVVDDTKQRRGVPSLNAIFDNRISVLTGDFMLAKTLAYAASTNNMDIVNVIIRTCGELSEGELIQLDNAQGRIIDEKAYMQTIRKKTASLLSACAEIGAMTVKASAEMVNHCRLFGEYLGYCFQIKDDIFDYCSGVNIGKPTGNDIREGKITLPLLYALKTAQPQEKERCIEIVDKQDYTEENIRLVIDFVWRNGGIDYAQRCIDGYYRKAEEIICAFPASEARESLLLLAEYLTKRKK